MPRVIIKCDDIKDVHDIGYIVARWEEIRQPVKSLKIEYQEQGKTVVAYENGSSDAVAWTFDLYSS